MLTVWLALVIAAPSQAADAPGCRTIAFTGEVRAGEAFVQAIGEGLALRLLPQKFDDRSADPKQRLDGWRIELWPVGRAESAGSIEDFIYPVNPPLRFNPWQDLGTSYGISAREKLQKPIEYAFILDEADFRTVSDLESDALWPPAGAEPSRVDERFLTALKNAPLGKIRFEATHYSTSENGMSMQSLTFLIHVTTPQTFAFSKDLVPTPSLCPARENWP